MSSSSAAYPSSGQFQPPTPTPMQQTSNNGTFFAPPPMGAPAAFQSSAPTIGFAPPPRSGAPVAFVPPPNTLQQRFTAPPPVSLPKNTNLSHQIEQQQGQVTFNNVQGMRPFDDVNQQIASPHNAAIPPATAAQHQQQYAPTNAYQQEYRQQQQPQQPQQSQQQQQQSQHQPQQSQHQQQHQQQQYYSPSQQQQHPPPLPPPSQQSMYGQSQPTDLQTFQQQHAAQMVLQEQQRTALLQQYAQQQQQQGQQVDQGQQQYQYTQQQHQTQGNDHQQQQQPQYPQYQQQQHQQQQQMQQSQQGYSNGNGMQSPNNGQYRPAKRVDRIDPKQIPRRMDLPDVGGPAMKYHTRSMTLPPAASADFVCVDEGNCSPRFIRLTTNNIAHEKELIESTKLCIGAIIQPLATLGDGEEPIAIVQYPKGPMRCTKCLTYVNPFFLFVEQGNAVICNICSTKNDVPNDYRCNLDANGYRRDRHERPELCRGSVEFEVGADFISSPIQDPVYLFVIDVSYGAVVSGLVGAAITAVRSAIDQLASQRSTDGSENRLKVGLITYDQSVHFYSLKSPRTEPLMFVMSDVDDPFVPCPTDEICVRVGIEENQALLHATLDMLAAVYERTKVSENLPVFGAAIAAAAETLMSVGGGKILILQSNLPQIGAGKLDQRDQINLYFTPAEKSLQVPQHAFYQTLATRCAEAAITVDLFVCANGYVDLATVGALTEKTGGQIFLYPGFNARKDGLALQRDLYHDVTRVTGFNGVMIVRCSTGLKVAEQFGNFYHRRVEEMELATIDADKSFGIRIEHMEKLKDKSEACIQCALLYTTASGHRRIRVHTISVPVTTVISNIFRFADLDAIINLSLKQAVRQLLDTTTCVEAQTALTMACIESLFVYRKCCASATSAGQLILPEPLKLLPLCTLGLLKHPLFQDGLAADERTDNHKRA